MAPRDAAAISRCLLCGDCFLTVVGRINLSGMKTGGRRGTEMLERAALRLLATVTANALVLLPCPTCNVLAHADVANWLEWVDKHSMAVLTPCILPRFVGAEEGIAGSADAPPPPLYANANNVPGKKPKWNLFYGTGPPGLELDRSRSGRLWGPSLRKYESPDLSKDCCMYAAEEGVEAAEYARRIDVVETLLFDGASLESARHLLMAAAPFFAAWDEASLHDAFCPRD